MTLLPLLCSGNDVGLLWRVGDVDAGKKNAGIFEDILNFPVVVELFLPQVRTRQYC